MRKIHQEGICRRCGWRVTVERADRFHFRGNDLCGPVETHNPFVVRDQRWPDQWVIPKQ
jgi:hypothetical protein